jgi:RHS repeat-associated protein
VHTIVNGQPVTQEFNLGYDAENRLVSVTGINGTTLSATFTYNGDGQRVKSVIDSETILFVGGYYEQKGSEITKYYFAGASRIAMRKYTIPQSMTVEYFLGDHLGSTSITTDNTGGKASEMRYEPWGEVRYSWTANQSTTPAYTLPKYSFTGQYSHMDDPSTAPIEGFGLMFYQSRFYDPQVGRFSQADTIVPGGVQGYDRYAYANNAPVNYTDPTGHHPCDNEKSYRCAQWKSQQAHEWAEQLNSYVKAAIAMLNPHGMVVDSFFGWLGF